MLGGSEGNERLTARLAVVLLVLLAAEGGTLLAIDALVLPHVFLGLLLVPPVALKLASAGWRMASYYRRRPDYVRRGPPAWFLRIAVAPVIAASTVALFGTGIAVLALGRRGLLLGLHKASFVVWFAATSVHVLAHLPRLPRLLRDRLPGRGLRWGAVGASLAAGLVLAVATLPAADRWQDRATGIAHVDVR